MSLVLKKYESVPRENENKKTERIIIKCYPQTKRIWNKIVVDLDAMNYEHALLKLIKIYLDLKKQQQEEELIKLF